MYLLFLSFLKKGDANASDRGREQKLALELQAARNAEKQAVKEVATIKFQQKINYKIKMQHAKKAHKAELTSRVQAVQFEMSEVQKSNRDLQGWFDHSNAEVVQLRAALTDSTETFKGLHSQIATQGATISTMDAELNEQRARNDAIATELTKLKEVLAEMSEKAGGARAIIGAGSPATIQQSGEICNDAYQTHLIGQIKEKNEALHKMRGPCDNFSLSASFFFVNSRTLVGVQRLPLEGGVKSTTISVLSGSVARCLIYADVCTFR